jgi:hypothetical protein
MSDEPFYAPNRKPSPPPPPGRGSPAFALVHEPELGGEAQSTPDCEAASAVVLAPWDGVLSTYQVDRLILGSLTYCWQINDPRVVRPLR